MGRYGIVLIMTIAEKKEKKDPSEKKCSKGGLLRWCCKGSGRECLEVFGKKGDDAA